MLVVKVFTGGFTCLTMWFPLVFDFIWLVFMCVASMTFTLFNQVVKPVPLFPVVQDFAQEIPLRKAELQEGRLVVPPPTFCIQRIASFFQDGQETLVPLHSSAELPEVATTRLQVPSLLELTISKYQYWEHGSLVCSEACFGVQLLVEPEWARLHMYLGFEPIVPT